MSLVPIDTCWLTIKQVAAIAQVGPGLVYRAVRNGQLRAAKIGARRDLRINRRWVDEWLEACAEPREIRR